MKRSDVCLTLCALWIQALIPLPVTEVKHYYEEHYNRAELKKYYTAMDEAAECHGIGHKPHTAVTGAPGDNETSTSSDDTHQDVTAAPDSAPDSGAPAADAGDSAGEDGGEAAPAAGDAAADPAGDAAAAPAGRRRRAVATNCPKYPKAFPEPEALVERSDQRWIYSCGNRSEWHHVKVGHCHRHTDGILEESICICAEDLCNGATARQAVPFLVLAVALVHLQRMIG
ncbi:hypothetical protein FJT64_001114 [Amphibalanus amphitrite]|uniref:Protein sleepless n=1 Tax=Amphibalanus amphitrite TaxID=1232801 RepID=A0A6A4VCE5_AMPAM|nr:hypothetical protein FJT64_001114 [Amphibalanus amphitrite]